MTTKISDCDMSDDKKISQMLRLKAYNIANQKKR